MTNRSRPDASRAPVVGDRASPPAAERPPLHRIMHFLGLHALVMYGITYYAVGAAAPVIARELDTTSAAIFGLLGAALVANGLSAPWVGRVIDRIGAGRVLLAGSVLRATAIAAMAISPGLWTFSAALFAVQLLSQLTEYDAAFAAAVQVEGDNARTSLSLITLWGGLASTVFWPLTALLLEHIGWRGMFLGYAAAMLAISVPVALAVVAGAARDSREKASDAAASSGAEPPATRRGDGAAAFVPLALAFSLASVPMSMPVIIPPLLEGLGLGAVAVVAGMLFGPSQTAGRLFEMVFGRSYSPLSVAVMATAVLPASLIILISGGANATTALIFAVLFGAGNGVGYVVRGTVVLSVFGPEQYGSWLGRLSRIRLLVSAVTPFTLALVLEWYGAAAALSICAVCGLLATLVFVYVWDRNRQRP